MTGAEGERKRGLYADLSFGDWQQSKTGDPSVVLTAASSPMRGAKMVRHHCLGADTKPLPRSAAPSRVAKRRRGAVARQWHEVPKGSPVERLEQGRKERA